MEEVLTWWSHGREDGSACDAAHVRESSIRDLTHRTISSDGFEPSVALWRRPSSCLSHSALTTVDGRGSQGRHVLFPGARERRGGLVVIAPPATGFWKGSFFVF